MRVSGTDILSRTTLTAHRNLVATASAALVVKCFGLNSTSWDFGIREISPTQFSTLLVVIIAYFSVSYALHIWGDLRFFGSWASSDKVGNDGLERQGLQMSVFEEINKELGKIRVSEELAGEAAKNAQSAADGAEGKAFQKSASTLKEATDNLNRAAFRLESIFSDVFDGYGRIKLSGWVILWGWYVCFPLMLSLAAIYSAVCA